MLLNLGVLRMNTCYMLSCLLDKYYATLFAYSTMCVSTEVDFWHSSTVEENEEESKDGYFLIEKLCTSRTKEGFCSSILEI